MIGGRLASIGHTAAIVVSVALATACSGSASSTAHHGSTTGATSAAPASTTNGVQAPHRAANTVRLYFVHGTTLAAVARHVATVAPADALRALLDGPRPSDRGLGLGTDIPPGTRLERFDVSGSTATVDLSNAFALQPTPSVADRRAMAEVVFTATQLPAIRRVVFARDHFFSAPLSRLDLTDVLDTVLTDTPAAGETVTSPMRVSGMSDTFEAHVSLRLRDAHGHVLADTATDATSGNGVWGTFAAELTFAKPSTPTGTLEVFDASQGDRAATHGQTIPVNFG